MAARKRVSLRWDSAGYSPVCQRSYDRESHLGLFLLEKQMKIKNWAKFQHFKDRRPPWVKLYRDILDDVEWFELDPKLAKILVMLWLIASEEQDGILPDAKKLAFRLRLSEKEINSAIIGLSHWLEHSDIDGISSGYQDDLPETETEKEKEEREKKEKLALDVKLGFVEFWKCYPKKIAKPNAEKAWMKIAPDVDLTKRIIHAISAQKLIEREEQFIPYPASWLNARRWEDGLDGGKPANGLKYWQKGYQS